MIDQATKERILEATRIEEVIGDFVSLRKHGTNYVGLCPFHQDKNPSMSVSATKGIFKCFSCGKAGTATSFLMEHEHMSYPEALKYLAKKYNIEVVEKTESAEEIAGRLKYESLLVVTEYAKSFYEDILWNTDIGRAVGLSYFRERKFSDETIRKFGLGYAAARGYEFHKAAVLAGYKKENLVDAAVCIEKENGDLYDRFFDRVIFPIYSVSGKVISFGGRTLKNDKSVAKYVNGPECEIYVKSNSLYGIYQAKSSIMKEDKAILVEGYADVISMHQAGVENVVASSGTSLTVGQIRLIRRFTNNITIIYDGDAAGIKASLRGIDLVLEQGMNVKVVLLPDGEDPDDFAKANSKVEILEYISGHETDFIAYKSEILAKDTERDPIERSRVIADILQSVSVIPDQILRQLYIDSVAERFGQKPDAIYQKVAELRKKKLDFNRNYERAASERSSHSADDRTPVEVSSSDGNERRDSIQDSFLAVCEKNILYYLLKFGTFPMHFEENMVYGAQEEPQITVSQYIKISLENDGLVMANELYKKMYDLYFQYEAAQEPCDDCEKFQEKICRKFTDFEEPLVSSSAVSMLYANHTVQVKEYQKALVPERHLLAINVPKAVNLYKFRLTEETCNALGKMIAQAQKDGDSEKVKELILKLQTFNKVKNTFAKELNTI